MTPLWTARRQESSSAEAPDTEAAAGADAFATGALPLAELAFEEVVLRGRAVSFELAEAAFALAAVLPVATVAAAAAGFAESAGCADQ